MIPSNVPMHTTTLVDPHWLPSSSSSSTTTAIRPLHNDRDDERQHTNIHDIIVHRNTPSSQNNHRTLPTNHQSRSVSQHGGIASKQEQKTCLVNRSSSNPGSNHPRTLARAPRKKNSSSLDVLVNVVVLCTSSSSRSHHHNTTNKQQQHDDWFDYFRALLCYKREHGHCRVPLSYQGGVGAGLGKWLYRQKRDLLKLRQYDDDYHNNNTMTPTKILHLETLENAGVLAGWEEEEVPSSKQQHPAADEAKMEALKMLGLEGTEEETSLLLGDDKEWERNFLKYIVPSTNKRYKPTAQETMECQQWFHNEVCKYETIQRECSDKFVLVKAGFRYNLLRSAGAKSHVALL